MSTWETFFQGGTSPIFEALSEDLSLRYFVVCFQGVKSFNSFGVCVPRFDSEVTGEFSGNEILNSFRASSKI